MLTRRWALPFLAALTAIVLGTTASASASVGAETRVGAIAIARGVLVEPPSGESPGQRLGEAVSEPEFVVATGVAAKTETGLWSRFKSLPRDERGSIQFGKGTTEAGNRGARYSGKWYDSEDAARQAAERYAGKHPNSCTFRGLCGAGDHYHVDKEINGFLVHTRHYYFPRN